MSASKVRKIRVPIRSLEDYIRLCNGLFDLTTMEIAVLAKFITYLKRYPDVEDLFSTEMRQRVATDLNVQDINGYVYKLKSKKAIAVKTKYYEVHPLLVPGPFRQLVFELDFGTKEG